MNGSRRSFIVAAILAAPLAAGLRVEAQSPSPTPMRIGIIGSGRQGGALGLQWARAGHEIFFSSRLTAAQLRAALQLP